MGSEIEMKGTEGEGEEDVDDVTEKRLFANKVFLGSPKNFGSEVGGWWRVVFSHPREYVEEGLRRVVEALQ